MFKIFKKKWFYQLLFIGAVSLGFYCFYLNHVIVTRFEERRWNLPSRIYSDSFPIYNGKLLGATELVSRLEHLGYRKLTSIPKRHGEYSVSGNQFHIYLNQFLYPHEKFEGQLIRFDLSGGSVSNLTDIKSASNLKLSKLEPEIIASIYDANMEDRTFIPLLEIPKHLVDAVIYIEDERFYSHYGVDPIGIARAFFTNIVRGRLAQGGSTLTQQMVKNFFLTHERTLKRKLNEMLMALIIDFRFEKEEILEVYLNEIYFGQRESVSVTGVEEAARLYFGKSVKNISIDEAALLAAMIQAPGRFNPFSKQETAKARRDIVLKKLLEHKSISQDEYKQSLAKPLPKPNINIQRTRPGYFIDFVKRQLKENFPEDKLSSEGLSVFTTLDMHMQRAAEKSVKTWLDTLETQRAYLKKNKDSGKLLQGALLSIQPKTGFVRAYVGGRTYSKTQFDIISQAKRQSGSVFKPFAYLAALDPHVLDVPFTLVSRISDEPQSFTTGAGKWKPTNYDHKTHGEVTLRTALANSYNISAVNLASAVGFDNVLQVAKQAGLEADLKPYPSMVLGSFEVTPLNLAESYSVFPNGGIRSKAIAIRRVVTRDGEVLEKQSLNIEKSFEASPIFLVNQLLKAVFDQGTAQSARTRGFSKIAGGKTGTTSDYRDAWFIGFTPKLLTLTWVGYFDNLKTELSGSSGALPMWTDFMKIATANDANEDFPPDQNIVIVPIDDATGLLHQEGCSGPLREEYFIEGTEPQTEC